MPDTGFVRLPSAGAYLTVLGEYFSNCPDDKNHLKFLLTVTQLILMEILTFWLWDYPGEHLPLTSAQVIPLIKEV